MSISSPRSTPDSGPSSDMAGSADSVHQLASDLRALRHDAGNPTLVALATKAGVSKSVISEALGGHKLPTENTVRAMTVALGADAEPWLARRNSLDPRAPKTEASATAKSARRVPLWLVSAVTAVIVAVVTSLIWWGVLQNREQHWAAQHAPLLGNIFDSAVDGADPMKTECREDAVVAAIESRFDDHVQVEMMYSNSCMGVWGRVTRTDGDLAGNEMSMRIYPANDPASDRSQERAASDVNSIYTPLLIEPDVEARVCGVATVTVDGEIVELGPPLCI